MKALPVIALVLIAGTVEAGTYTVTTTTQQDTRLDRARLQINAATCGSVGLPDNCSQPQARAIDPNASIYSDVGDFINRYMLRNAAQDLQDQQNHQDLSAFCSAFAAASTAARANACSAVGAIACPSECK